MTLRDDPGDCWCDDVRRGLARRCWPCEPRPCSGCGVAVDGPNPCACPVILPDPSGYDPHPPPAPIYMPGPHVLALQSEVSDMALALSQVRGLLLWEEENRLLDQLHLATPIGLELTDIRTTAIPDPMRQSTTVMVQGTLPEGCLKDYDNFNPTYS